MERILRVNYQIKNTDVNVNVDYNIKNLTLREIIEAHNECVNTGINFNVIEFINKE